MSANDPAKIQVHGTCVALEGVGILLRGPAGAGKSDLAVRLIDGGAVLVADDLCQIHREGEQLLIDLPDQVDPVFRGRIANYLMSWCSFPSAMKAFWPSGWSRPRALTKARISSAESGAN